MDQNVGKTQKLVILMSVLIGLLIVLLVGYSLWQKAKAAEIALAQKEALDAITKKQEADANVSVTGAANETSNFSFENLTNQNGGNTVDSGKDPEFGVISTSTPEEEVVVATKTIKKYTAPKKVYYNTDRPLTAEEIRRIRQLPIDGSATGNLQNKLELDTNGQYKAQYK